MTNEVKEPLIRIVKKDEYSVKNKIMIRAIAIFAALIVDGIFLLIVTGLNPFSVYGVMFSAVFGNKLRFSWAMRDLVTLLCIGIALAPAFKMKFWNIGAEGQVLVGALAAALVMVNVGDQTPNAIVIFLMFLSSILAGALWGFIPGFFKAKWGTNETLFTMMMNYVAIQIVSAFVNILRGQASSLGKLNMATQKGWFPKMFGQRYYINIIIVLILMFVMYFYLKYSKHGYEIAVVGESENTARYTGISVKNVIIRTMVLSGAICGLVGFLIVGGRDQTISASTAGGNGFTAIIVAWLAKFNTFYMALISFLLIFLDKGAAEIASKYALNDYASDIISGIILFFILGSEFFINYRIILRKKAEKKAESEA